MQSSTFETGLTYSGDNKEISLRNRWIYVYVYVCVYIYVKQINSLSDLQPVCCTHRIK